MTHLTASERAAIARMTDAQLRDIIRFARMDQSTSLCRRNALRREAEVAGQELARRGPVS